MGQTECMSRIGLHPRRSPGPQTLTALVLVAAVTCGLAGCADASRSDADAASTAAPASGAVPQLGSATLGALTMSGFALTRTVSALTLTGRVVNAGSADTLTSIASQVTTTSTLSPPLAVAAGATVELGAGRTITLTENARLEPGGTVDLTLHFARAGDVQVFTSFIDG